MNLALLLIISMLSALTATTLSKFYTKDLGADLSVSMLLSAVSGAVAVLIFLVWNDGFSVSLFTLLLGLGFGLITATQTVSRLKALDLGPMSYTELFLSSSMIIPALSGTMFFGESISVWQIIGLVLTLCSFVLALEKNGEKKKASIKWLVFCLLVFLTTGSIGVLQKVHQSSNFKLELNGFLIVAFSTSSIVSLVATLVLRKPLREKLKDKNLAKIILISVFFGAFVAVNNKLNLFLSGKLDSALFFPLVNGGGLVLTTLSALILFKEKLSIKRSIGVLVGLVAVILLCNPF